MGAVEAPSGHCADETFLPVDGLKQRLARAAASRGIVEVADSVVALVSHAVQVGMCVGLLSARHSLTLLCAQERTRSVLEKLAVICTHRMESLRVGGAVGRRRGPNTCVGYPVMVPCL